MGNGLYFVACAWAWAAWVVLFIMGTVASMDASHGRYSRLTGRNVALGAFVLMVVTLMLVKL